ncbi:HNH endonuclease [Paenibacillus psychroresistens]|nr:HNH endonuclease [Paenibacillus psychroresistens]
MNYFIVFQGQSYTDARSGGYLWAPTKNEQSQTFHYWTSMTKVLKGDLIFNSVGGLLLDLITATEDNKEQEKPINFDRNESWRNHGWYVKADYIRVNNPIRYIDYKDDISKLQAQIHAPFNINGGGNQGYLYEISEQFADFLLGLIGHSRPDEVDIIQQIENELPPDLDTTEKERIVKTRIGQGIFKTKLLKFGCNCKLCPINNIDFLTASHTKPWKDSNNHERLDEYNGFLLCPAHNTLFDRGYISFNDDGRIMVSKFLDDQSIMFLNVQVDKVIDLLEGHKKYLTHHRESVFKQ